MAADTNSVVVTGRLTKAPETRAVNDTSVTDLRLAVNNRRKTGAEWEDVAGFYSVSVWGAQGENCAKYLDKGAQVTVQGRLEWREAEKDGQRREFIRIVARDVQFHGGKSDTPAGEPFSEVKMDTEDIPF